MTIESRAIIKDVEKPLNISATSVTRVRSVGKRGDWRMSIFKRFAMLKAIKTKELMDTEKILLFVMKYSKAKSKQTGNQFKKNKLGEVINIFPVSFSDMEEIIKTIKKRIREYIKRLSKTRVICLSFKFLNIDMFVS